MPLSVRSIGPYEVSRELGRGGMGVVYLARDTRLDRPVAIKALPEHLLSDDDRLARFEREAKIVASLNHPAIAAVYALERDANKQYLVMEFVEGQTLAERLERGPLTLEEALTIARQIAEALEAAHEKGVIHRDLKPSNVMITDEGAVKVLDFGLARSSSAEPASSAPQRAGPDSPTVTTPAVVHSPTIPGAIMGTAGYMSPEQARGRPVDRRSDIFSFGCVLYEMISGGRPFQGETVADAIGATLHKDPEVALLPAQTPARVRELITSCLAKDRKNRLHDIGDARLVIERALGAKEWTSTAPVLGERGPRWLIPLLALLAVGLASAAFFIGTRTTPTPPPPPVVKLTIPTRTPDYVSAGTPSLAPDGRSLVFSARSVATGLFGLWLHRLDAFDATPLAETTNAESPFWSPDSRFIAFHADGNLWAIDVAQGGSRRLISDVPFNEGAAWGPDGTIILARSQGGADGTGGIYKLPAVGGKAELLTTVDTKAHERAHRAPTFLPDGRRFLYLVIYRRPDQQVNVGRVYAGSLDSPERTLVAELTSDVRYVAPGRLVYVEDGTAKAAPFDPDALRITGEAVTIADDVDYFRPVGAAGLSVAGDGSIAFAAPETEGRLVWFDTTGKRLGTLGPPGLFGGPRISPDGTRVATQVISRRTGLADVWIYSVDRPASMRLAAEAFWEGMPIWSRDGSLIYYSTDENDFPEIFTIRSDGSGDKRLLYGPGSGGRVWFAWDQSPDAQTLLIGGELEKLGEELRLLGPNATSPAAPFKSSPADQDWARFSPDGRWVVYNSTESGTREVYLAPYPGPGPSVQLSAGGFAPVWSPKGDAVYYLQTKIGAGAADEPSKVMAVDLSDPAAFASPPLPRVLFECPEEVGSFDIAPDGTRFLLALRPIEQTPLRVILNALSTPSR